MITTIVLIGVVLFSALVLDVRERAMRMHKG